MIDETGLRVAICDIGASLFSRGLTSGSSGNLSVRLADGFLMTPTGVSLGRLDPARLSRLDRDGALVSGDVPTKESFLHMGMYAARPQDNAIVHLHSTYSTAVSCLADVDVADVMPPLTAYYAMRVGRLPLVKYYRPGDQALADAARVLAEANHALLLANHGPIVSGVTLAAATDAVEVLEQTAQLFLLLRNANIRPLTAAQAAELY